MAEPGWVEKGTKKLPIDYHMTSNGPYLRLSDLGKIYDFTFHWDQIRRKVSISHKNHLVQVVEGWDWLNLDGKVFKLPGPLQVHQGHLEVPLAFAERVIPEVFGPSFQLQKEESVTTEATELEEFPLEPVRTIAIDPGHGGPEDIGAFKDTTQEKAITLKTALLLKEILSQKLPEVRVFLTRESDVPVPLQERNLSLTSKKADLFISIHVNSSSLPTAHGIETYFLGVEASDKDAERVARFENTAIIKTKGKKFDFNQWLRELKHTEALSESSLLAELVHEAVVKETKSHSRGVKQAMFYVLMGAQVPSILLELNFISNANALKQLQSDDYLKITAQGISEGILSFHRLRLERVAKLNSKEGDLNEKKN